MTGRKKRAKGKTKQTRPRDIVRSFEFADAKNRGVTVGEWAQDRKLRMQDRSLRTLLWLYSFMVIATFLLIGLWGFGYLKFADEFMYWLGGAIVVEAIGLAGVVVRRLWN